MKRLLLLCSLLGAGSHSLAAQSYEEMGAHLSPAEQAGRDLWFKATAGNKRHHNYVLQQRFGAPLDLYRIMGTDTRGKRFSSYGLINDPDCKPGNAASFGFDICPGDEELLKYVGKNGYKDPACEFDQRPGLENPCHLEFGTSTGVVGFRKFPNPRFRADRWPGWKKWNIQNAAIEPPFLFGTTCASCHVGFDPSKPPRDPEFPEWANLDGTIGNIYMDNTAIFASGLKLDKPLGEVFWQALSHVRPGTTDTSAVPQDAIHNTGTFNAILNFDKRPTFAHTISRWRRDPETRQWQYGTKQEQVMHILKGGEDSVGADLALIRVYVNIGMCSEECWQNNLINIRQFSGPFTSQKPFSIAQCRRDCANWRSMEDRIGAMAAFLSARRPSDLIDARNPDLEPVGARILSEVRATHDPEYAAEGGVFNAGRKVYAKACASCHSSAKPKIPGQPRDEKFFQTVDFLAKDAKGVRIDWLGNDERSEASKIGTTRCRALHSNHNKGQIWEEFSSDTFKAWPQPSGIPELSDRAAGGRGYYRNISLLNLWANAPFMHHNAIGPEFCSPHNYQPWACVPREPSIEARLALYEASMRDLLYPDQRQEKITRTSADVGITLNFPLTQEAIPTPILLKIPKGTPVGLLGSLDMTRFVDDVLSDLKTQLQDKDLVSATLVLNSYLRERLADQQTLEATLRRYSNCDDLVENKGHTFGSELSDREKTALIQYMKNF